MPGLLPDVDPDGLVEYSVVYTDRAVNHMSQSFQQVMRDIHAELTSVYNAAAAVVVPGSGTFGMEAVARQFVSGQKALVVRNGWFSYRWSQIFEVGSIPSAEVVLKAQGIDGDATSPAFAPAPIDEVVAAIAAEKPAVVFAPHVETSAGMILPDDYMSAVANAAHEAGALFALDCIASGTIWVDMQALGVDILCSAPQKGWSGSPCAGLVMLSERAVERMGETQSTSFSCDLAKWHSIMGAYLNGGHAYHATMPTDALRAFRDVIMETKAFGYEAAKAAQQELGDRVRGLMDDHGFKSVAAPGFGAPGVVVSYTSDPNIKSGSAFVAQGMQIAAGVPLAIDEPEGFSTFRDVIMETKAFGYEAAKAAQQELGDRVRGLMDDHGFKSVAAPGFGAPGVVVSYTSDPNIKSGSAFVAQGMQIAAGVPLAIDEPEGFSTFRLGLFGLDKLKNVDRTVDTLGTTLDAIKAG